MAATLTPRASDLSKKGVKVCMARIHELSSTGGTVLEDNGRVYHFRPKDVVRGRYKDLKLNMKVRIEFDLMIRELKTLEILEEEARDIRPAPDPEVEDLLKGGFGVVQRPESLVQNIHSPPSISSEETVLRDQSSTRSADLTDGTVKEETADQSMTTGRPENRAGIAEVGKVSKYHDVPTYLIPSHPQETKVDLPCFVVSSEYGEVVVSYGREYGKKLFKFSSYCVQQPFTPEVDDILIVHLEIEDGKLKPIKFVAEEEAVWPEAKIIHVNRSTMGRLQLNEREEGVFSMRVIPGGGYPRLGDVVVAKMIRTRGRPSAWRAIEISHARIEQFHRRHGGVLHVMALTDTEDRERLSSWMEDKNGIVIQENLNFGRVAPSEVSAPRKILIKNEADKDQMVVGIDFDDELGHAKKIFRLYPKATGFPLPSGETYELGVTCDRTYPGIPEQNDLLLRFKFDGSDGRFEIARLIHVEFIESGEEDLADAFGQRDLKNGAVGKIYRAPRTYMPKRKYINFDHYAVPYDVQSRCDQGGNLLEFVPCLAEILSQDNYKNRMKVLIYLQNIGDAYELSKHSLSGVRLAKYDDYLAFDVFNLNEGRPSILCYDEVVVSKPRSFGGNEYRGRIMEIRDLVRLMIKFAPEFHEKYVGNQVDIRFVAGISSYIRTNHAIGQVTDSMLSRLLFPNKTEKDASALDVVDNGLVRPEKYMGEDVLTSTTGSVSLYTADEERDGKYVIRWFNPLLNDRQRLAVRHIVAQESRIPYLIFGPPGTGKTCTIVEAMMQIFHMRPEARHLVAVPSNSAGDLICERLVQYLDKGWLRPDSFIRYVASQRDNKMLPEAVRPFVVREKSDADDKALARVSDRILAARIVIATWHMCGNLHLKGLNPDHFTHVFIDEAGHLTEPESLVPITVCPDVRVILAGDPKQLGPVVVSQAAKSYGLGRSLLERLMEDGKPYQRDLVSFAEYGGFDPSVVTQLIENYRSHPKILKLYSELSYNGELVPRIEDEGVPDWIPESLKRHYPLLVVGCVSGTLSYAENCPSPYNLAEMTRVCSYVFMLMKEGGLSGDDIGVVTPYRKQAEKIRAELLRNEILDVKVASVEEFQGSERKVIVISTVQTILDRHDRNRSAMFWANSFFASQRHTNVAISRARSFLIVIGDPKLMEKDPHWRRVLRAAFEDEEKHFLVTGGNFFNPFLKNGADNNDGGRHRHRYNNRRPHCPRPALA